MGIISLKQAEEQMLVKNKYYTAGSSMPEQFIYRSLIQIFPEAVNRYHDPMINMEYDINIPELKTYIEYNGTAFHNTEEKLGRDKIKRLHCEKIGRTFIQIIEDSEVLFGKLADAFNVTLNATVLYWNYTMAAD